MLIPVKKIRDMFDLTDGNFSLVQNNLILCYNYIGGVRGTISVALLNRIIRNVCFKKVKIKEDTFRVGSMWSNPLTISDIMSDCFSGFESEAKYKSARNNYNNYIADLIENKMFYRFGKNNFYAYTYEKNIFSWGYMCRDVSYVYPKTIKVLLRAEKDLYDLFWNVKKPGSDSYVMEMDEFGENFACFIDQLVVSIVPSVKNRFRRFDKSSEDAKLYLDEIRKVLSKTDDFEGYKEHCMLNPESIPISIKDQFDELIPVEERGGSFRPPVSGNAKGKLFVVRKRLENFEEVESVPENKLKVSEKPEHLLSLFERRVKEIRGFEKSKTIFKNLGGEIVACKELYDLFVGEKINVEMFIREWIDWYIHHGLEGRINSSHIAIHSLMKTFSEFKEKREREEREMGAYSSLYENIDESFKRSVDIEQICRKYGFVFVYNYLWLNQGRKEAEAQFENLLASIEGMTPQGQKSVLWEMQKATHCNRSKRCGYFDKDSQIKTKMGEFMIKTACTYKDFGLSVLDRPNSEEAAFWEKIRHEIDAKEKSGNS